MSFNEGVVNETVKRLKDFAVELDLGAPIKVHSYLPPPWCNYFGVALEWPNELRHGIAVRHEESTFESRERDMNETVRRLRAWSSQHG